MGRSGLYSSRQVDRLHRTSFGVRNQVALRGSSRTPPWKPSTWQFCIGRPTGCAPAHPSRPRPTDHASQSELLPVPENALSDRPLGNQSLQQAPDVANQGWCRFPTPGISARKHRPRWRSGPSAPVNYEVHRPLLVPPRQMCRCTAIADQTLAPLAPHHHSLFHIQSGRSISRDLLAAAVQQRMQTKIAIARFLQRQLYQLFSQLRFAVSLDPYR